MGILCSLVLILEGVLNFTAGLFESEFSISRLTSEEKNQMSEPACKTTLMHTEKICLKFFCQYKGSSLQRAKM